MTETLALKCSCGKVRGRVEHVVPGQGYHMVCLCDDCQAFAHFLGQGKTVLDKQGGTGIFPVVPAHMKLTQGLENIQCVRLTEKGMVRWYAGCCRTPIANTPPTPGMPYAGLLSSFIDDGGDPKRLASILGPVRVRLQSKFGIGPLPENSFPGTPIRTLLSIMRFLFVARIKGLQRPSPFFVEPTGKLLVEPYVLAAKEREDLRKFCGPKPTAV